MCIVCVLPDSYTRFGREEQPLARTDVERVVPRIQIADGREAVHLGRVVIGELCAHRGIAHLRAPGLSEGNEELPIALPHTAPVRRSRAECEAVCVEGGGEADEICDV